MEYCIFSPAIFSEPGFFKALAWKFQVYLSRSVVDLFTVWLQQIFFPVFLVSIAVKAEPKFTFARFSALLLAWQLVLFAFLRYESMGLLTGRYFLWFAPVVILGALAFVERWGMTQRGKWTAMLALSAVPLMFWTLAFLFMPSRHAAEISHWDEIAYLQSNTQSSDWIASNVPTQITWYAKRTTVNIPNSLFDFQRLIARYPVKYLYLSDRAAGEPENYPAWRALLDSAKENPSIWENIGFTPEKKFSGGILLKRR
jgi:hypothetical protein